jgi:hypothetical protein
MNVAKGRKKREKPKHNNRKHTGCTKYKGWYLLNTW